MVRYDVVILERKPASLAPLNAVLGHVKQPMSSGCSISSHSSSVHTCRNPSPITTTIRNDYVGRDSLIFDGMTNSGELTISVFRQHGIVSRVVYLLQPVCAAPVDNPC